MAKKYDKQPHLQTELWKTEAEWWAWLRGSVLAMMCGDGYGYSKFVDAD